MVVVVESGDNPLVAWWRVAELCSVSRGRGMPPILESTPHTLTSIDRPCRVLSKYMYLASMVCYLADNIWFRRETSRWVVVVVSSSEFGRTIIPDSRGGSDHGRLHAFICLLIRVYMYMYIVYVFTCTYVHFAGRSNCSHLSHRFNFSNACDAALKDGVG